MENEETKQDNTPITSGGHASKMPEVTNALARVYKELFKHETKDELAVGSESTCSTPERGRYVTYVFDREYDQHRTDEESVKYRNILGKDYNGATPVVWSEDDQVKIMEDSLDILRKIREGEIDNPEEYLEEWFEKRKDVCYW